MLIAIDHGNKQIKTENCPPFTSGLRESLTRPLGDMVIFYDEKYYSLMDERIPYRRDKTEDERFFILTLFAIARELDKRGTYSPNVVLPIQLAVGLPPAHYGSQYEKFERYFKERRNVNFTFQRRPYSILITDVLCFPQAYAAACTMLTQLCDEPRAVVVDIGGFTADYLQIKFGEGQLSASDSLENGVILLYNRILSKVNAEFDLRLEESDVDVILERKGRYAPALAEMVEREAVSFVGDLFGTLRERGMDLRTGLTIFTGGGAILLRRIIENTGKVGRCLFVTDINANAKGFAKLYLATEQGA